MRKEKTKPVTESLRGYNFSGAPTDFLRQITEFVNGLPKTVSYVTITTEAEYGDEYAVVEYSYERPYTAEELAQEKALEERSANYRRAQYEALKKEFKDA